MSQLDPFFKFKIGDVLRPVIQRPGYTANGMKFSPQYMVVVERYLVECYGGIQATYRCRTHTSGGGGILTGGDYSFLVELVALTEPELTLADLPPLTDEAPPPRARRTTTSGDDNAAI